MNVTSKSGLLASPTKKINKHFQKKPPQFKATLLPAPVTLRPYACLYNPFPDRCSLLCNHPTNREAKDVLKRARQARTIENKSIILPDDVKAIRESLARIEDNSKALNQVEYIPEELFRRYTQTDSRPLTPAPTVASVKTRGSSSRRCVTPDPITTSVLHERTLLILDLRKSHSQEIISYQGLNDPPLINILQVRTPSASIDSLSESPDLSSRKGTAKSQKPGDISAKQNQNLEVPKTETNKALDNVSESETFDGEEEIIKRKGKRKKKRGRDLSRGPLAVQASIDPETQISSCGTELYNSSIRPSLILNEPLQNISTCSQHQNSNTKSLNYLNLNTAKSILAPNLLKHLQRELNAEIVDLEFDKMKRAALNEAYKTLPVENKHPCDEMLAIQKELNLSPINAKLWLSLPRVFTRSAVRFELPLHSRTLKTMKPLEYLKEHCIVSKGRKLLYNLVFNRHRDWSQENHNRILCNKQIPVALGEMMGSSLSDEQIRKFRNLVNWKDDDVIDFKTWCGICALFERTFAAEFCTQLPTKDVDPCNEVEIADFQLLSRRLQHVTPNENLVKILNAIKEF